MGGHSGRAFASHAGDRDSISDRDGFHSLKQVVRAPLPNTLQQGFGDDHYKALVRVTVRVAR